MPSTRSWRTPAALAAAAVIILSLAASVALAAPSGRGASTEVIALVGHPVNFEFIDNGAPGDSPGDVHAVTNDLYLDGERVGYDGVVCTTIRMDTEPVDSCYITQSLPAGIITAQVIKYRSTSQFNAAITGGTGEYRDARGQIWVDVTDPNRPPKHYFTVHLDKSHARR